MADRRTYNPAPLRRSPSDLDTAALEILDDAVHASHPLAPLDDAVYKTIAKNKRGQPTKYDPAYDEIVTTMHMLGARVLDICALIGISQLTYYNWTREHPNFLAAVINGKELADAKVARSLFHRATGYSHAEEKISINNTTGDVVRAAAIKHYPPDTAAAVYWLNNRRRKTGDWRSSVDVTTTDRNGEVIDTSKPPRITIKTTASESKE